MENKEIALRLTMLEERVNSLVTFISEALTAVDVRLAKIERELERAEQAPTE